MIVDERLIVGSDWLATKTDPNDMVQDNAVTDAQVTKVEKSSNHALHELTKAAEEYVIGRVMCG